MNKLRIAFIGLWLIPAFIVEQSNAALNRTATPIKTTALPTDKVVMSADGEKQTGQQEVQQAID